MKKFSKLSLKFIATLCVSFSLFGFAILGSKNTPIYESALAQDEEVTYNLKSAAEIGRALLGEKYVETADVVNGPFNTFTHINFVKGIAPLESEKIVLDANDSGDIVAVITKDTDVNAITVYSEGTILAPVDCTCFFGSSYNYVSGKATGSDTSIIECHLDNFDTRNVTKMAALFLQCTKMNVLTGVENFDTSKVTTMTRMFDRCQVLEDVDVGNFNTQNVTDFSTMFQLCYKIKEIDVSKWDTSNVTTIRYMFNDCDVVEVLDVSNWNTSNITDMTYVFNRCYALKSLDVTKWDTSNVVTMDRLFQLCSSLKTIDVSNFDTSNVTNMACMFQYDNAIEYLDLSNFDTRNVTNMQEMFKGCGSLKELDLSNFDLSKVTNIGYMIGDCPGLKTLNISGIKLNPNNNVNTGGLFRSLTGIENIYMDLDVSNVTGAGPAIFSGEVDPENSVLTYLHETSVGVYELTKIDSFTTNAPKITVGNTKHLVTLTKLASAPTVNKVPYTGGDFYYDSEGKYFIANKLSDVGSYETTIFWCDLDGNIQKIDNKEINIEAKEVDIYWGTKKYLYDKNVHIPNVTIEKCGSDDLTVGIEIYDSNDQIVTEPKDAGVYTIKITSFSGSTSNYVSPVGLTNTFEIAPMELEISWGESSFVYDEENHLPEINANFKGGDNVTFVTEIYNNKGQVIESAKEIGAYKVKIVGLEGNEAYKYALPEDENLLIKDFKITGKKVSVEWDNLELTYNGKPQLPTATIVGADGDSPSFKLTTDGDCIDVGEYKVQLVFDNEFYFVEDGSDVVTFEIGKKEISIDWESLELQYNGETQLPVPTSSDLDEGEDAKFEVTCLAGRAKIVGTYYASVKCSNNYKIIAGNTNVEFKITPKVLDVVWENSNFVYDKAKHAPEASVDGIIEGDVCFLVISGEGIHAGNYTAFASLTNNNYKVSENTESCNFKIERRYAYGYMGGNNFIYNGKEQYIAPYFIEYDGTVVRALSCKSVKEVGIYHFEDLDIVYESSYYNDYNIDYSTSYVWVDKAPLTVYIRDAKTIYGEEPTDNGFYIEGFVNGDTIDDLDGEFEFVHDYINGMDWGSYIIDGKGFSSDRYRITYEIGYLFVDQRTITIDWGNRYLTYNGKEQSLTPTIGNIVFDYEYEWTTVVYDSDIGKDVGTYRAAVTEIYQKTIYTSNYKLPENNVVEFTIRPCKVTPFLVNDTLVYNGDVQIPTIEFTGLCEGEELNFGIVANNPLDELYSAGKHSISVIIDDSNYTTDSISLVYEILPAVKYIVWENTELTYNGELQTPKAYVPDIYGTSYEAEVYVSANSADAGIYSAYVIPEDKNINYKNQKISYVVNKKLADIVWGETSFVYDGTTKLPSVTIDGITIPNKYIQGKATDAGTYEAILDYYNKNYILNGDMKKTFKINPSIVKIVWLDNTLIYNGNSQVVKAYATTNDGRKLNYSLTIEGAKVNAGNGYEAKVTGIASSNYTLPETGTTTTFDILPCEVNVIWDNSRLVYNGQKQVPTAIYIDILGNINDVTVTTGENINAGSYVATATINDTNYVVPSTSEAEHIYNIEKASIENEMFTLNPTEVTYNGEEISVTLTSTLGEEDYDVTGDLSAKTKGTYSIVITGRGNYEGTVSFSWTINPNQEMETKTTALSWGISGGILLIIIVIVILLIFRKEIFKKR